MPLRYRRQLLQPLNKAFTNNADGSVRVRTTEDIAPWRAVRPVDPIGESEETMAPRLQHPPRTSTNSTREFHRNGTSIAGETTAGIVDARIQFHYRRKNIEGAMMHGLSAAAVEFFKSCWVSTRSGKMAAIVDALFDTRVPRRRKQARNKSDV